MKKNVQSVMQATGTDTEHLKTVEDFLFYQMETGTKSLTGRDHTYIGI